MIKIPAWYFICAMIAVFSGVISAENIEENYSSDSDELVSNRASARENADRENINFLDVDEGRDLQNDENGPTEAAETPKPGLASRVYSLVREGVNRFRLTLGSITLFLTKAMVETIRPLIDLVGQQRVLEFVDVLSGAGVKVTNILFNSMAKSILQSSTWTFGQDMEPEVNRLYTLMMKPVTVRLSAEVVNKIRTFLRLAIRSKSPL